MLSITEAISLRFIAAGAPPGQVKSIRTALEEERECATVLQQIAACRGAINSLLVEIVDGEIRYHVLSKTAKVDSREARAAEDLVEILHRYIK